MNKVYVNVRTPLKRNGKLIAPGKDAIALPVDEAKRLIAARAVEPRDLEAPAPRMTDDEANDPAGAAPGAAGEAGETDTNPDDAAGPGAQSTVEGLVDINSASAEEIAAAANGIGINTARDLVKWRKANGPFESLDDLVKVGGIGKATVERNQGVLTA